MIIHDRPIGRFESVTAHFGQNCADLIDTNRGIVETFTGELRDMHEAVSDHGYVQYRNSLNRRTPGFGRVG